MLDTLLRKTQLNLPASSGGTRIVVGMSGGVDSAVTAFLLKELGFDVVGLFMKNWDEDEAECPAEQDWNDVLHTSTLLKIPCFSVSFAKEYRDIVFEEFLDELKKGHTPNPDILCNREIKFKHLLDKATELKGEYLATGHYARHAFPKDSTQESDFLLRGIDPNKDQTYFLSAVSYSALKKSIFPVGNFLKSEIRTIAEKANIPVAKKRDSTGICFIGKRDFRPFIGKFLGFQPGRMVTPEGKFVGLHQGVALYTLGQRKGLGIGGPGDAWFVVGKIPEENLLLVTQGDDHPYLYSDTLVAEEPSWLLPTPPQFPLSCTAKIRYRQQDTPCTVTLDSNGLLYVEFKSPQRAITPRQQVVFYQQDICLGGAFIKQSGQTYFHQKRLLSFKT